MGAACFFLTVSVLPRVPLLVFQCSSIYLASFHIKLLLLRGTSVGGATVGRGGSRKWPCARPGRAEPAGQGAAPTGEPVVATDPPLDPPQTQGHA